ncbi:MAG TPA: COX15/CtaA family protein [Burkholderiales bacterium]
MNALRPVSLAALILAFVVVVVGAYVRLSDAGLGCPDWPLCYGKVIPSEMPDAHPVQKQWKEMGHRFLAGTLGILLLALALMSFRVGKGRGLAAGIVALVLLQATLGMWTVTMLLKPAIVTAHLLGGMTILALLGWYALEQQRHSPAPEARALRAGAAVALAALAVQIALGGWVSANYAALACLDLPLCRGQVMPPMDFANAFHVVRELGQTADGALLSNEALTAIHWTHRMFALVVSGIVLYAALRALSILRTVAIAVMVLVLLQLSIGVANVAFGLPLPLAAAHNAGAAALLLALVVLNFTSFRGLRPSW